MSLEEKILLYEERILATEQTDMAKENWNLPEERVYAQEQRKLARLLRKKQRKRGNFKEPSKVSSKVLKILQGLIKEESETNPGRNRDDKVKEVICP